MNFLSSSLLFIAAAWPSDYNYKQEPLKPGVNSSVKQTTTKAPRPTPTEIELQNSEGDTIGALKAVETPRTLTPPENAESHMGVEIQVPLEPQPSSNP